MIHRYPLNKIASTYVIYFSVNSEHDPIAVEPKIIYPDKGVLGIEDTFLTTDGGAQRLTNLPRDIWQV